MTHLTDVTFDGFVHAENGRLVDGQGRPLLMRGVGLGNWLLPEGYMWRFPREGPQSPREIEALIADLVGEEAAAEFWRGFRERYIAEADISAIAEEGFDHVRLPLSARLLIDDLGDLRPGGLEPIDRLIEWCRRHRLWVILDLHGAPGGQTGTNIDDSPRGLPDLFIQGGAYREQTISLWAQLAARYRDETVIAAYDLLNEPLPNEYGDRFGSDLVDLYRDLNAVIRAVDPNHLLTYEGTRWSTDWSIFTEAWDTNSMLQFHKYWSAPDRPSIARFIEKGRGLSLPIYMGEGGENDPAWIQTAFGMYEDLGISWSFWPWKKLDTWTSPVSVTSPAGWAEIVDYALGRRPRPSAAAAQRALGDLLERIRLDACSARPDVVSALFRRVPIRLAPEAFGFRGQGASYRTTRARPLDWFRSDDMVTVTREGEGEGEAAFGPVDQPWSGTSGFEVTVESGDWLEYTFDVTIPSRLTIEITVGPVGTYHGQLALEVDGQSIESTLVDRCVRGAAHGVVPAGRHRLRICGVDSALVVRQLRIAPETVQIEPSTP